MRQIVGGKYITEVPDEASLQITLTPLPHHVFLAPPHTSYTACGFRLPQADFCVACNNITVSGL